ncbi:MAG: pantoate--beta-alanine ligase [Elusimicrobia bacterium CG11_big_fil_rev_8_21_14_0_20_64_6]|nr:MAG: pantoate--beta-alanine ligase [Elusimicrobia bacterium CG11_big_fil_rev_8_21_14_0_20_64_6]
MIPVVRTKKALARLVAGWRKQRLSVGFVPTMGALHEGHAALVKRASRDNDRVIVSVFVNPLQFGPNEDYGRYPRALPADRKLVAAAGASAVYAPSAAEMYPKGFHTHVEVEGLSNLYCGKYRPGHFRGVATVVLKLFNQVRADRAYFGEKDWQQVRILEDMIRDLDVGVALVRVPIVREKDGLAQSSRNAYLSPRERGEAPALRRALESGRAEARRRNSRPETITAAVRRALAKTGLKVQYAAVWDGRLLVAATLGRTRLIDNLPL